MKSHYISERNVFSVKLHYLLFLTFNIYRYTADGISQANKQRFSNSKLTEMTNVMAKQSLFIKL